MTYDPSPDPTPATDPDCPPDPVPDPEPTPDPTPDPEPTPTTDPDETPVGQAIPTTMTRDYLGRRLINATPGTSDATDFMFRGIKTGNLDYLGRPLVA
jgi:hypothetical protein